MLTYVHITDTRRSRFSGNQQAIPPQNLSFYTYIPEVKTFITALLHPPTFCVITLLFATFTYLRLGKASNNSEQCRGMPAFKDAPTSHVDMSV